MNELNPAYLSVLAEQLASISAFLGGFAATYLGTLIIYRPKGLAVTLTISLAASSAVAFVVTVVAATMLTAMLHPFAPVEVQQSSPTLPQIIMTLGFALGAICLLASLGSSGWIKSRTVGILTTTAATLGLFLMLLMTVKIN